jgi:hypothetical protein
VVILSLLHAFADDDASTMDIILPIVSALGFLIIGGGLVVTIIPRWIEHFILSHCSTMGWDRGWVSLGIMFPLMFAFMPLTFSARSSPLLGTFLAGLTFCSNSSAHDMYLDQFKRITQWLMRIFFAASIGFQVPVKSFTSHKVALHAFFFTAALLGKVATGALVPNFAPAAMTCGCACSDSPKGRSHHMRDRLIVGFSMAAEAEFAFIIAVFCVTHNLIDQEQYAAIVLAVLLSTIIAPSLLRSTFHYFNKQLEMELSESAGKEKLIDPFDDEDPNVVDSRLTDEDIFFCIQTKSVAAWGLQMKIMKSLCSLHLDVIDHRSWHPYRSNEKLGQDIVLVNEIYVKDTHFEKDDTPRDEIEAYVQRRVQDIERKLEQTINQTSAVVKTQRWTPFIPKGGLASSEGRDTFAKRLLQEAKMYSRSEMVIVGEEEGQYVHMGERPGNLSSTSSNEDSTSSYQQMFEHLDDMFVGQLEGLFRRDNDRKRNMFSPLH